MRFAGQLAIITGSSAGLGFATAKLLAAAGACVLLNGRDAARLASAGRAIGTLGPKPLAVRGDANQPKVIKQMVALALEQFGTIDLLINNAGGGIGNRPFEQISSGEWEAMLSRNLGGAFFLTQAVVPVMKQQGHGCIVNVSSFAGRQRTRLASCDYTCAKAGLIGFTRHLAWELGPLGIRVNAVAPGITLTERVKKLWAGRSARDKRNILAGIPLRRLAEPDEVARVIAFLASSDASYITGATIDINGGSFMG